MDVVPKMEGTASILNTLSAAGGNPGTHFAGT